MPWICTGTPSGHGPKAHSPVIGIAGLVEERSARTRSGLGEPLRFADPEGEAGVDQAIGQVGHGRVGTRAEHLVPDRPGERHAVVDALRACALEEVGSVHGMPAGAQLLGERANPVGQSLHVMEQNDLGHVYTPSHRTTSID